MQQRQNADPDELTKLFVEITDDLSYSRTFYSKRSVRVYLNYLSQLVFLQLNKNKKVRVAKFFRFFTHGLPMEFARSWKAMILAFVIFTGSMMVGIVSSASDIKYANKILGDQYIEMTDENVRNGDPMAVYHQHNDAKWSTFGITLNNTMVASRTYASGVAAGVPTIIILIKNGIMVGTFHYYLYHKGVLGEAMWIIWLHGVLEISAIVIAGGAGLLLAGGLLFPGTYTRLQSLRISAKRSFKIALGCVFILIISGFIEGSITRHTQMPMALKYIIVLGSLAFICFYFLAYPIYLYKTKIKTGRFVFNDNIPHVEKKQIALEKVREVGEIFNDTLNLYRQCFGAFFKGLVLSALPILGFIVTYHFFEATAYEKELYWWISLRNILYGNPQSWLNFGYFIGLLTPVFLSSYYAIHLYRREERFSIVGFYKYFFFGVLKLWPLFIYIALWHVWPNPLLIFAGILMVPFIFQFSYQGFFKEGKYGQIFKEGNKITMKSWFGSLGVFMLLMIIPVVLWVASLILSKVFGATPTTMIDNAVAFFLEHINPFTEHLEKFANAFNFSVYYLLITLVLSFLIFGLVIKYHSVRERFMA